MALTISACVITYNEDSVLERCLQSLSFANEIVVVDSGSTDKTLEIARQYTSKIITHPWQGFSKQRNVCLENSTGDWIFFLDSDEQASEDLGKKLREIANTDLKMHPVCYSIKRIEYFLGKKLEHGPGNPSHQWRFFKRLGVRFTGDVHEYPKFEGPVGMIEEPIHHLPNLTIDRFLRKLNHYTTLEALDRFAQGERTSLFRACASFFGTFFKNGVRYRGFWNGKEGFVLTLLESMSRVIRYLKLWVFWKVYEGHLKINLGYTLPEPGSRTPPLKAELERHTWVSH